MSYFTNFPTIEYRFGNQSDPTLYQNLGVYVDLVDLAKDDAAFYTYYDLVEGDRADQISQKLYGRPDLHWTFPIMNDNIKIQGWPLSYGDLSAKAAKDYPNKTITTRTDISQSFDIGSIVSGSTSGAQGVILRKRLDFGQIIVGRIAEDRTFLVTTDVKGYARIDLTTPGERFTESDLWQVLFAGTLITTPTVVDGGVGYNFIVFDFSFIYANVPYQFNMRVINYGLKPAFVDGEIVTTSEDGVTKSIVIDSVVDEFNATHHYANGDGEYVDINPNAPCPARISVTFTATGATQQEIDDARITTINLSIPGDYAANTVLTGTQRAIDQGFYQFSGSLFKAVVSGFQELNTAGATYTLSELIGTGGHIEQYYPDDTDISSLQSEINTQLADIISIADANVNGTYDITMDIFLIIDNQLNLYFDNEIFGVSFSFLEASTTKYRNRFSNGTSVVTTSPVPTSRGDAWDDLALKIENYIVGNLSLFNPALLTQVTFFDRIIASNNSLKQIKVLRPDVVEQVVKTFNDVLLESNRPETSSTVARGAEGLGNVDVSNTSQPVSSSTVTASNNNSSGYY